MVRLYTYQHLVKTYQDKGKEQKLVRLGRRSNESYVPEKAGAARAKHFHQGYRRIEPRGAQYSHRSMQSRDGFQWSTRTSFEEFNAFTRSFLQPSEQRAVYRDFLGYDIKRILSRHSSDYGNRNVLKVLNSNIKKADYNGSPVIVECLIRYALHAGIPVDVPILSACVTAYGNAARHDAGLYWIKKAEDAAALFEKLKLTQNVTTLNARITAYGNAARHDAGLYWIKKAEDAAALFEKLKLTQNVTTLNARITAYGNAARHDAGLYWIQKAEDAAALFETLKLTQNVTTLEALISAYANVALFCSIKDTAEKYQSRAFALLDNLVEKKVLCGTLGIQEGESKPSLTIDFHHSALTGKAGVPKISEIITTDVAVAVLVKHLNSTKDQKNINMLSLITGYRHGIHYRAAFEVVLRRQSRVARYETDTSNQGLMTVWLSSVSE